MKDDTADQKQTHEEQSHEPHDPKAPPNDPSETLVRERDEYLHGWKRALADYENFKKDQAQRSAQLQIYQLTEIFRELVPLFDTLDQTIQHLPASEAKSGWYQGLQALHAQWKQFMHAHGVQPIVASGKPFDPIYHEALATETDSAHEEGVILKVISEGYTLNDSIIIRPAKVIVNKLTT